MIEERTQSIFEQIEDAVVRDLNSLEGHVFQFDKPCGTDIVDHFPAHIIFFLYKDVYYDLAERRTTGKIAQACYPNTVDPDNNRRTMDRNIKRAVKRKNEEAKERGGPNDYYQFVAEKSKQVGDISSRYHINALDAMALEEYGSSTRKLDIIDLLIWKNIKSSKAVSNQAIVDAYQQYYKYIRNAMKESDAQKWIESLLDLSNMESQVGISFFYAVAKYMERYSLKDVPDSLHILFSNVRAFHKRKFEWVADGMVQSRFLYDRINCIEQLTGTNKEEMLHNIFRLLSLQIRTLRLPNTNPAMRLNIFDRVPGLYQLFEQITSTEAKDYFSQKYNLFEIYTSFSELSDSASWSSRLLKDFRKVAAFMTGKA